MKKIRRLRLRDPKKFNQLVQKGQKTRTKSWQKLIKDNFVDQNRCKRKKFYLQLRKLNSTKSYTPQQIKQ